MLILISLLAFIAMLCSLFLFLPLTYNLNLDIRSPFHVQAVLSFLNHGLYYEWDYTFGQKPRKICYTGWQEKHQPVRSSNPAVPRPNCAGTGKHGR